MSRGIGVTQQAILRELKRCGTNVVTFEMLRWTIWNGSLSPDGNLPQAWNTSVDRAVKTLAARGDLNVESRPLANLDEWMMHYPGKSLNKQVHDLRQELLPHIVAWIGGEEGPEAKFSKTENEEFAARKLAHDQMEILRTLWGKIEPCLRQYYGHTGKDYLFALLVRGRQLFGPSWPAISINQSFWELVTYTDSDQDTPELLRNQVITIRDKFLPGKLAKTLEFKSYIRAIAKDIPSNGHCSLSKEAEDELYKRCGNRLTQLPGFKPAPASNKSNPSWQFEAQPNRPRHSPLLKKLLDHSVFQNFRFLTAC